MSHVDYLICLHNSSIIVLRWYELFLVLHYNDNVISKLLRIHDVIDIVTHIVWIMQYESSNRENIFFNWFSMKTNLTSWLDTSTAVKSRLKPYPDSGLTEPEFETGSYTYLNVTLIVKA